MDFKKTVLGFFSGLSSSVFVAVMYFFTSNHVIKDMKSDVKSVSKVLDTIENVNDKQKNISKKRNGNRTTTPIRGTNRRKTTEKILRNGTKIRKSQKRAVRKDHKASGRS